VAEIKGYSTEEESRGSGVVSRGLRRSGISVCLFCEWLNWRPDQIVQVGIGMRCQESDVMKGAWPNAEIIGFEPHPAVVRSVKKKYPGQIIQKAAWSSNGTATLYTKDRHQDGSSLFQHVGKSGEKVLLGKTIEVETATLDDELDGRLRKNLLLWIDSEGAEIEVMKGGEEALQMADIVNIETTARPLGADWCSPVEVHDWLSDRGYFRQWIHTNRSVHGQVDVIYVKRRLFRPSHCCCPCEIKRYGEAS